MYVSSEVRRREMPESTPDPSRYASSTGGASFLAILSEVGRTKNETSDENTDRTREVASESPDGMDEVDQDHAVTDESATESSKPETGEAETSESDDTVPSSTEHAATTATPTVTVAVTTSVAPAAEAESAVAVTTATISSAIAKPVPTAETGAIATPTEPVAPVEPSAEGGVVETIEGAVDPALTADMSVEVDVEPAPAATIFPKTLKAILAEDAVRPVPESAAPESAPPASETVASLTEIASEATAEIPDSTPIPHATAMESGGVRPQTTGVPRIPMSNLPGELAQQIHLMQQEGTRSMRLRLVPENLGEIHIEIQGTGDAMKVRLISGNPAVRDALESQMGDLKDAMEKQGLALDQASVDGERGRRGQTPEPDHKPSASPYRETNALPEGGTGTIRRAAPIALGSGALNVLA